MRIGIEAQRIMRKKKHGMDIVILEVLRQLREMPSRHEYYMYAQPDEDTQVVQPSPHLHIRTPGPALYPVWEQRILPKAIREDQVQLLHCTGNTAPLGVKVPLVITLHDIIYLEKWLLLEGSYYQRFGNLYRRWNVPRAARKADMIITVSDYERQRIIEALRLPDERVRTIYNACGSHFTPERNKAELDAFRQQLGLPEKFILFLGNTAPKKNLPNVLKAMGLLRQRGQLQHALVMPDFGRDALWRILKLQGNEALMPDIILTGYIPNQQLPNLYRLADLFLYPSLRESFGIPILEAMACGTPVITSNTSAMPEVAGPGALLIDPEQPEELAHQIQQVLSNTDLRNRLIAYGLQRAMQFSWYKTAKEVVEVYDMVST